MSYNKISLLNQMELLKKNHILGHIHIFKKQMDPSEKLWNTGGVWLSALDCLEGFKGGYENLGKAKYDTKGSEQILLISLFLFNVQYCFSKPFFTW